MDKRNEKVITIFICVILSFGLWLYISNVENPNRSLDLKNVNVTIENESSLTDLNLAVSPNQKFSINLKVEGPAKKIYSISRDDFKLKVDISSYALKIGTNIIPVEVVDYPDGINIKNTGNLTISIVIEKIEKKEMSITSNVDMTFEDGITKISSDIDPNKVTISGPSSTLNKVNSVILYGSEHNINSNFSKSFNIKAVDENGDIVDGVELDIEEATLIVKVSRSKEVPIKINYVNSLPNGINKVEDKSSLDKVSIIGDPDTISSIESIETEPIDLSQIHSNNDVNCNLIVPDGVTILNHNTSVTVSIKVENNNTVTKTIEGVKINYKDELLDNYTYEHLVNTVNIEVSGKESDLDNIVASDILVEASLKDINKEGENDIEWIASLVKINNNVSIVNPKGTVKVVIAPRVE